MHRYSDAFVRLSFAGSMMNFHGILEFGIQWTFNMFALKVVAGILLISSVVTIRIIGVTSVSLLR